MKVLLLLLLFPVYSYSQHIKAPTWSQTIMYFESAKMKTYDPKTKKLGPEIFKTCKISFGDEDLNSVFTVDIPDKFYCKDTKTYSIVYNLDEDNTERIAYTLVKDSTMCILTFYFLQGSQNPEKILVSILDNFNSKLKVSRFYMLSELK